MVLNVFSLRDVSFRGEAEILCSIRVLRLLTDPVEKIADSARGDPVLGFLLALVSLFYCAGPGGAGSPQPSCYWVSSSATRVHEGLEVLRDGRELEFVSCSAWAPEAKSFKTMMAFEVRELHLD
jgi:hypothetical protein